MRGRYVLEIQDLVIANAPCWGVTQIRWATSGDVRCRRGRSADEAGTDRKAFSGTLGVGLIGGRC